MDTSYYAKSSARGVQLLQMWSQMGSETELTGRTESLPTLQEPVLERTQEETSLNQIGNALHVCS